MRICFPLLLAFLLVACGADDDQPTPRLGGGDTPASLTAFELEHGIGPVTSPVELGPIDEALVAKGMEIYQTRCESCHRFDGRFVGPALNDITDRRSPAFIMNIVLNPKEMLQRHPEGQRMLAEYMVEMPYQNVSESEARAIVEYLRTVN
jgi:mono/diheme cytochrome c family protein